LVRAPEFRKVALYLLAPETVATTMDISEADLKKAYQDRSASFTTPERRHVQQIVFPNVEEARAAAERLAKGETFEALAAERGLKEADFDLGTIAQSAMVDRAVGDAAFALKQGEISTPVEGRFGVALVRVVVIEPGQTKPFAEVADQLKRDLATEQSRGAVQGIYDKIEDDRLAGVALPEMAQKFNLKTIAIDAIDRAGQSPNGVAIPDLPPGPEILTALFTSDIHGDHDPIRITGGGYVWYDVIEITPSRDRTLEEVKDQVLARWRDDEIATRLRTKATEMLDKIKAGTPFAEVAAAANLKVEWLPGLKRGATPPSLSTSAVEEIFRVGKDAAGTAQGTTPTSRVVFRVTEITLPASDAQAGDAGRIEEALRRTLADDLVNQYVVRLEKELGVSINQNVLNQIAGGSQAN
jgi:peptidyl-prolyl cis-trans isomerase D